MNKRYFLGENVERELEDLPGHICEDDIFKRSHRVQELSEIIAACRQMFSTSQTQNMSDDELLEKWGNEKIYCYDDSDLLNFKNHQAEKVVDLHDCD